MLHKAYFNSDVDIPDSEDLTIANNGTPKFLPQYILLENGEVMQKRKRDKKKILAYPNCKDGTIDHMYSMLILFSSFGSESELLGSNNVQELYEDRREELEAVERKLFPLLVRLRDKN